MPSAMALEPQGVGALKGGVAYLKHRGLNGSPTRLIPCRTPSVSRQPPPPPSSPRLSDNGLTCLPSPTATGHWPEPLRRHRSQKDYADVPDVNVTYFEVPQKPEDMAVSLLRRPIGCT
ncbi:hypothetical protein EYF80_049986 [Liparis tanakae]|uniref:Uncharacterized protein n=1 Tax=Liparis tanakae TaxID=230148 RepID=A0A4Z2FG21_9TELE|nr:hypothetical protein EYF80_049986 [Liparis tanakae]